ncbi:MAG: serine hydrolase, partial [bacterium]
VVHRGQVIGERYAEGFSASTPLPGWSMTKSVTSAMVGLLQTAGKLDISAQVALDEWQINDDPRNPLTWDHLLRISRGLFFL